MHEIRHGRERKEICNSLLMLCSLVLINQTNQNGLNDLSINYLGYYTDNGGYYYYYYHTESGINYEATLN